ncbi:citrate lyase holo-[acyl-carrier protein] synthase [Synergistaceae bacterium OttesenSCG-928-I11]|nr:citrate lyase holo-[acyl-carrier protein] synthase [Synergistaceae bacterium OttesenSCG-928-I11]
MAVSGTSSGPDFLYRLLAAREERAVVQKNILSSSQSGCLVQMMPNIPGYPKRIENDTNAVAIAEKSFKCKIAMKEAVRACLINSAGIALLLLFPSLDAADAKKIGIEVENTPGWGRALDIDIITRTGIVSRKDLGLPARVCVMCGKEAKICARERSHNVEELRDTVRRLLACTVSDQAPSSSES